MKEGDEGDGTNKANKVYNTETSSDFQQFEILKNEKKRLEMINDEKADELRKLKLVKLYRSKNDLEELGDLIKKWREASQEAIQELYDSLNTEPKPPMPEFLKAMNIDTKLIHYKEEDEEFY